MLSLLKYRNSLDCDEVKYNSHIQDLHTLAIINPFALSNTETQSRASEEDVGLLTEPITHRSIMSKGGDIINLYGQRKIMVKAVAYEESLVISISPIIFRRNYLGICSG